MRSTLSEARLAAGSGSVALTGNMKLGEDKAFKVNANASRFNPAALGDYPQADINAVVNANGVLSPGWKVNTDFALRPSRLFDQPLSGKGKLTADAKHVTGVDANLALGQNTVNLNGAFGAAGERLAWRLDGRDLATLRRDLYGAVVANGVVTGTMDNPRTTFVADANALGWVAAQRKANNSNLHVSGEAWLAGTKEARFVEAKGSGTMARFNPAAFGSPLPGSINGAFDASGRSGADWRGALDLKLAESTLVKSPLWGHARLAADKRHVSGADVDLHVGANVVAAKGSFGAGGDRLDWRIDAPQLGALGPDYGGLLRGAGTRQRHDGYAIADRQSRRPEPAPARHPQREIAACRREPRRRPRRRRSAGGRHPGRRVREWRHPHRASEPAEQRHARRAHAARGRARRGLRRLDRSARRLERQRLGRHAGGLAEQGPLCDDPGPAGAAADRRRARRRHCGTGQAGVACLQRRA